MTSQPVECYEFRLDTQLFRYTSDEVRFVASVNGRDVLYEPLAGLSRSALGIVTTTESAEIQVTIPVTHKIATEVAMFKTPVRTTLTFRRYERDYPAAPILQFEAVLGGASISGEVCTLKFPDTFQAASAGTVPRTVVQPGCNWTFGDRNCKVNVDLLQANITGGVVYLGQASQNGAHRYRLGTAYLANPIGHFRGGTLSRTIPGGAAEVRTILALSAPDFSATNTTGVLVGLNEPFTSHPSNAVYVIRPGCSKMWHLTSNPNHVPVCTSYGATARFSGFPFVPTEKGNPFTTKIG